MRREIEEMGGDRPGLRRRCGPGDRGGRGVFRKRAGSNRCLGEQCHAVGLLTRQGDAVGRIPTGHRGDLPGIRARHLGRPPADAAAGPGAIIQVGSALAYRGIPLQSAYCAAKHAIHGFCDSLRSELIHDKIRVKISMVQLPAMNTPQFDWVKSRLDRKAQPVPPIYQPEVAAVTIVFVSHHPRREMWGGAPTVKAILVNKLIPGLLDRFLGWTNYQAQQTEEPEVPGRAYNLWEPLPGDHGPQHSAPSRWAAASILSRLEQVHEKGSRNIGCHMYA